MACYTSGVGRGDEVIVPALTFVATANSVLYTGAYVVFADIKSETDWNIDPADVESKITARTKALIVVHYAGYPCDMKSILYICKKYGLTLIEDCAHAIGSYYNGKHVGVFGRYGCFSFYGNKNVTCAEGGIILADKKDVEILKIMRSHGMTANSLDKYKGHNFSYDVILKGFNYRIDDIRAALAVSQLQRLEKNNEKRSRIVDMYKSQLAGSDIIVPFFPVFGRLAYHIFPVLIPERSRRSEVIEKLKSKGIQTSIHYVPVPYFSIYRNRKARIPRLEKIADRIVTLPLYPKMGMKETKYVCDMLLESI
jgi:dTDP-4-amino-4,6-dideoxygalactose transaminase